MIDRETVIRLARRAVNNGDGTELSGDAVERFAQLVFLEAAASREPLTDDEVVSLLDSRGIACEPGTAFAIAEAVERAHGIRCAFDDEPRVVAAAGVALGEGSKR